MTAAYTFTKDRSSQGQEIQGLPRTLRLVHSTDASQAQGPEAGQLIAAVQQFRDNWTQLVEGLLATTQLAETLPYQHVALKTAFTVKVNYVDGGKMKPRTFHWDD